MLFSCPQNTPIHTPNSLKNTPIQILVGSLIKPDFMLISDYNLCCFIKKYRTNTKGEAPLYIRIRMGEDKMELSTNQFVKPSDWDKKKELVINTSQASAKNALINKMRTMLEQTISQLIIAGVDLDISIIKRVLNGEKIGKVVRLIEATELHNIQFEKQIGIKYSYGSYKNYKTTLAFLHEFVPVEYKVQDIPLKEVNDGFCERFYDWLTTVKGTSNQNGANKHIQRIKKIVNYSLKMGYINVNPIKSYSLSFRAPQREALTWEEVQTIQNLKLQNERLEHVRNIILFQIYTGLSYADVKIFSKKHLYKGVDGNTWLKMERTKTHNTFAVPILKPAQIVLDQYIGKAISQDTPIYPVLSNQKMNAYLKIIQEIAGISKNLHTHLFRHTFASTVTLQSGVPLETVSKMLGHSKITMTQIYARVGELKISIDMKDLSDKLNSGNNA